MHRSFPSSEGNLLLSLGCVALTPPPPSSAGRARSLLPSRGVQSAGSVPSGVSARPPRDPTCRAGYSRGRKLEKALAVKHVESNIPASCSRESALLQRDAEW